jgi:hypothetical protein
MVLTPLDFLSAKRSDIGFDLEMDYIAPHILDGHIRINTGIKYHRVTGNYLQSVAPIPAIAALQTTNVRIIPHHRAKRYAADDP